MAEHLLANRWLICAVVSPDSVTKRQDGVLDLCNLLPEVVKLLETATYLLSKEATVLFKLLCPPHHTWPNYTPTEATEKNPDNSTKTLLFFDSIGLISSPAFCSALDPP